MSLFSGLFLAASAAVERGGAHFGGRGDDVGGADDAAQCFKKLGGERHDEAGRAVRRTALP